MKKHKQHVFHAEKCENTVRAIIKDSCGNTITLLGHHSFEWSIVKERNGKITMTTFSNREKAVKEFNTKYIKK